MQNGFGKVRLFVSDLDGTLLGDSDEMNLFKQCWGAIPHEVKPLLCYNSGRQVGDMLGLIDEGRLPVPDYLIGTFGTEVMNVSRKEFDRGFQDFLESRNWDIQKIDAIMAQVPAAIQQEVWCKPYHRSWSWHNATDEQISSIRNELKAQGVDALVIYSHGFAFDIVPANSGKGISLRWLVEKLGINLEEVLIAGDSGNDIEMFRIPSIQRIVMCDARAELLQTIEIEKLAAFQTTLPLAKGVLEGLQYFGVISGENGNF